MEDIEPISAWLQLTDCSEILLFNEVDAELRKLFPESDENLDVDGPWWNQDQTRPMRFNVFVADGIPPDFTGPLDSVAQLLREGEYLLFHEMNRFEHVGGNVCSLIVVSKDYVERATTQDLVTYLRNRAGVAAPPPDSSELDSE